jgi:putative addiction module component (TIGR02574 family)
VTRIEKQGSNAMDYSIALSTVRLLSLEDRIKLLNTLSEEIAADPAYSFLTDAEKRELDRRLEEGATDPDNSVPWEQIRPEAKARWGR